MGLPDECVADTLFDLVVPVADTLRSLNLSSSATELIAVHSPLATRAQPWLWPRESAGDSDSDSVAGAYFRHGDSWDADDASPVDACRLSEGLGERAYQCARSSSIFDLPKGV